MRNFFFLLFAFALASFFLSPPAAAQDWCYPKPHPTADMPHDSTSVCPNTVATLTPAAEQVFVAYPSRVAGGGGSPADYAVTEESPSGWVPGITNSSDGGSWSDYFTFSYNTSGVPVVCSATPVQSESGGFGAVSLQQHFGSYGGVGVDFTQNNAQHFFPSADLVISCNQVSQLVAVPGGGGSGGGPPPRRCKVACRP